MIYIRIISSILLSLILLLNTPAIAITASPIPNAGNFIQAGLNGMKDLNTPNLINKMDESISGGLVSLLKFLYQAGILVAVCAFAFMAVQFLVASPQQKGQIKASLLPFFIGLLFFIAGVPIAILIINIFLQFL